MPVSLDPEKLPSMLEHLLAASRKCIPLGDVRLISHMDYNTRAIFMTNSHTAQGGLADMLRLSAMYQRSPAPELEARIFECLSKCVGGLAEVLKASAEYPEQRSAAAAPLLALMNAALKISDSPGNRSIFNFALRNSPEDLASGKYSSFPAGRGAVAEPIRQALAQLQAPLQMMRHFASRVYSKSEAEVPKFLHGLAEQASPPGFVRMYCKLLAAQAELERILQVEETDRASDRVLEAFLGEMRDTLAGCVSTCLTVLPQYGIDTESCVQTSSNIGEAAAAVGQIFPENTNSQELRGLGDAVTDVKNLHESFKATRALPPDVDKTDEEVEQDINRIEEVEEGLLSALGKAIACVRGERTLEEIKAALESVGLSDNVNAAEATLRSALESVVDADEVETRSRISKGLFSLYNAYYNLAGRDSVETLAATPGQQEFAALTHDLFSCIKEMQLIIPFIPVEHSRGVLEAHEEIATCAGELRSMYPNLPEGDEPERVMNGLEKCLFALQSLVDRGVVDSMGDRAVPMVTALVHQLEDARESAALFGINARESRERNESPSGDRGLSDDGRDDTSEISYGIGGYDDAGGGQELDDDDGLGTYGDLLADFIIKSEIDNRAQDALIKAEDELDLALDLARDQLGAANQALEKAEEKVKEVKEHSPDDLDALRDAEQAVQAVATTKQEAEQAVQAATQKAQEAKQKVEKASQEKKKAQQSLENAQREREGRGSGAYGEQLGDGGQGASGGAGDHMELLADLLNMDGAVHRCRARVLQAESDLSFARDQLQKAEGDLRNLRQVEWPEIEQNLAAARQQSDRAQSDLEDAIKSAEETKSAFPDDKAAQQRAEEGVQTAVAIGSAAEETLASALRALYTLGQRMQSAERALSDAADNLTLAKMERQEKVQDLAKAEQAAATARQKLDAAKEPADKGPVEKEKPEKKPTLDRIRKGLEEGMRSAFDSARKTVGRVGKRISPRSSPRSSMRDLRSSDIDSMVGDGPGFEQLREALYSLRDAQGNLATAKKELKGVSYTLTNLEKKIVSTEEKVEKLRSVPVSQGMQQAIKDKGKVAAAEEELSRLREEREKLKVDKAAAEKNVESCEGARKHAEALAMASEEALGASTGTPAEEDKGKGKGGIKRSFSEELDELGKGIKKGIKKGKEKIKTKKGIESGELKKIIYEGIEKFGKKMEAGIEGLEAGITGIKSLSKKGRTIPEDPAARGASLQAQLQTEELRLSQAKNECLEARKAIKQLQGKADKLRKASDKYSADITKFKDKVEKEGDPGKKRDLEFALSDAVTFLDIVNGNLKRVCKEIDGLLLENLNYTKSVVDGLKEEQASKRATEEEAALQVREGFLEGVRAFFVGHRPEIDQLQVVNAEDELSAAKEERDAAKKAREAADKALKNFLNKEYNPLKKDLEAKKEFLEKMERDDPEAAATLNLRGVVKNEQYAFDMLGDRRAELQKESNEAYSAFMDKSKAVAAAKQKLHDLRHPKFPESPAEKKYGEAKATLKLAQKLLREEKANSTVLKTMVSEQKGIKEKLEKDLDAAKERANGLVRGGASEKEIEGTNELVKTLESDLQNTNKILDTLVTSRTVSKSRISTLRNSVNKAKGDLRQLAREVKKDGLLNAMANFFLSCLPVRQSDFGKPVTPGTLALQLDTEIQAREEERAGPSQGQPEQAGPSQEQAEQAGPGQGQGQQEQERPGPSRRGPQAQLLLDADLELGEIIEGLGGVSQSTSQDGRAGGATKSTSTPDAPERSGGKGGQSR